MIFYVPKNEEGRTILCTTQIDSDAIQKNAEKIDIPTDKAGLKDVIQDSFDTIFNLQQNQINTSDIPEATEQFFQEAKLVEPKKINSTFEATQIEDFILNHASVAQVENLFSCLGNRFAELRPKE